MSTGLRWALVGASDIARTRMIPAMRAAGHEIVGVYSRDRDRGTAFARRAGVSWSTDVLDDLLTAEADAVYVSTTNELHRPHTEAAARAGKNVLCEKPLALSTLDAEAMLGACGQAGVVFATNHHQRQAATLRTMAHLIAIGVIGRPLAARVQHTVALPPRLQGWRLKEPGKGAGVVLDLTVHDVDTLRFVLGREVRDVVAQIAGQALGRGGAEDAVVASLRFSDDILVTLQDAFTFSGGTALEVFGSEGALLGRGVLTQDPVGDVVLRRDGAESIVDVETREDLYLRVVREFEAAVSGRPSKLATGEDGVRSLAVAEAVLASARDGVRSVPRLGLHVHSS